MQPVSINVCKFTVASCTLKLKQSSQIQMWLFYICISLNIVFSTSAIIGIFKKNFIFVFVNSDAPFVVVM